MRWIKGQRTHGAFHTEDEALDHAHRLLYLLGGCPFGYAMCLLNRYGAWVVVSYPRG